MRAHLDDADLDAAAEYERRFRHDVMAHVHAFGDQAPAARPFMHLGATSAFVTDNADLIVMREGLRLLLGRLDRACSARSTRFASRYARPALPRLHPLPAGAAHHRRQARDALDAGLRARRRGALPSARDAAASAAARAPPAPRPRSSSCSTATTRRCASSSAGSRRSWASTRPFAVTGQTYPRKVDTQVLDVAERRRAVGREDGDRPPAAAARGRAARAVRVGADRLQRDGLQAEPDARRADRRRSRGSSSRSRPTARTPPPPSGSSARSTTAPTGGSRCPRRSSPPTRSWCSPPTSPPGSRCGRTVIRRHVDEQMPFMATERWLMLGVKAGRRPAGAARGDPAAQPGRRRGGEPAARPTTCSSGSAGDAGVRAGAGGVAAGRARSAPLHRPRRAAGRASFSREYLPPAARARPAARRRGRHRGGAGMTTRRCESALPAAPAAPRQGARGLRGRTPSTCCWWRATG